MEMISTITKNCTEGHSMLFHMLCSNPKKDETILKQTNKKIEKEKIIRNTSKINWKMNRHHLADFVFHYKTNFNILNSK